MSGVPYNIVLGLAYALSLLPMRLLYSLSNIAYFLVYHLFRYRRRIVRGNLTSSFPEKGEKEIKTIEKRFYRWFCDMPFESIKLLSISDKELSRRLAITNSAEIMACFSEGQSTAGILGHYCNWEWLSCVSSELPRDSVLGLIYHPLYNHAFNRLYIKIRSHGTPIAKKDILRYLIKYKREGRLSLFGYIADQCPKWENIHLWLHFLNHDTPVFTGAERIMRKMNNAVFFVEMTRPRRGYYTCTYRLITKDAGLMPEHEITRTFFRMLEETIRRQPEFYLWSHNRWKRTREEFDKRFRLIDGRVVKKE